MLKLSTRNRPILFGLILLLAIGVRVAAMWAVPQPVESDALSYFTMAQGFVERGEWLDTSGLHAFASAGYSLLFVPFFMLFGSAVSVALAVNIVLCIVSMVLIYRLVLALSDHIGAGLLAMFIYALWLPGIWNATRLAKENLAIPLLLGIALCAIWVARNRRPRAMALTAGLLWGASLVTGGSALLLCAGVAMALILLWRAQGSFTPAFTGGLCFLAGAAMILAPWLYATQQMLGRPVLNTNTAFNLYLGNNPAATGRFVSIVDTPLAGNWEAIRLRLGEIGNSDRLQAESLDWIANNPGRAAELAALKLLYFWEPNIPDADDFAVSKLVASIRIFEVAQYMLIMLCGLLAFRSRSIAADAKWIYGAMIAGFWIVHAPAYIIARYRDPIIPLLIIMAAVPVAVWLQRFAERKGYGRRMAA